MGHSVEPGSPTQFANVSAALLHGVYDHTATGVNLCSSAIGQPVANLERRNIYILGIEGVEKHVLITRYHSSRAARGEMLSINDVQGAGQDGGVPLIVVFYYSHGQRRAHRTAQEGRGRLERVA